MVKVGVYLLKLQQKYIACPLFWTILQCRGCYFGGLTDLHNIWQHDAKWGCVKTHNAEFAEKALSILTDNSRSSRILKMDITCKEKQMPQAKVSDDYTQEFVIYNETDSDKLNSLTVAYRHKFYQQNKKKPHIVLLVLL